MDELKPTRWQSPLTFRVIAAVPFGRPADVADPSLATHLSVGGDGEWRLDLTGISHGKRREMFSAFDRWRSPWVRTFQIGELGELSDLVAAGHAVDADTPVMNPRSLSALWEQEQVTLHSADLSRLAATLGDARDRFDDAGMKGIAFEPLGEGRPRSVWVSAGDEILVRSGEVAVLADDEARCWLHIAGHERVRLVGWERQAGHVVMFAAVGDDVIVADPDALIVEWLSPRAHEVAVLARPLSHLWRHLFDGLTSAAAFALPRGVPFILEPRP